jgi:hypothetical protein
MEFHFIWEIRWNSHGQPWAAHPQYSKLLTFSKYRVLR